MTNQHSKQGGRRLSLRVIIDQVKKYIDEPIVTDWDSVNEWLNMGIDNLSRFCPHPDCRKEFKNFHGRNIHLAKKHGWTKKSQVEYIKKHIVKDL